MKCLPLLLMTAAIACGPAHDYGTTTPASGSGSDASKPAAAGDVSFDVPTAEIKGMIFEPEALGRPGVPLLESKKKTTLEKQRALVASQASMKDLVIKEAGVGVLATMLYQKSKTDKDNEKALLSEARQVLRDVVQADGDKTDETTLRLLGSYELMLDDYPGAEKAWGALVVKAPKDKEAPSNRAWWAYSLLQQGKNAEALAAVKDEPVSDKQPELAYITAWAKWRNNDSAGAWAAIVAASKGWGTSPGREVIDRDVYLFAARSKEPFAEASQQLFSLLGAKQKAQQYEVLAKLGVQAYPLAGRWADAIAAINRAISTAGTTVPPNDLPTLRYSEADYMVRLDAPDAAVGFAKQALDALPACGAKCNDKQKQDVVTGVLGLGTLFHVLYATANDVRYYQPAHDLYAMSMSLVMDDKKRTEAQENAAKLEATLKNTKAGTGTHDKGAIAALLGTHNQEIQACYESGLAANPKLGGALVVHVEVAQTGEVKGTSTEPKAGLADMALVAGCVADHVKTWKLPKRGSPGTTRLKLSYSLAPRKKEGA